MYKNFVKRIIDFLLSIFAFPFFAFVFVLVSPLILIDDGFPVFYCADRIGKNGKLFKMYKFRSMKNNSPDIRMEDGSTFNSENDPRVTRIGKILRKTSIDEIPQILNVLLGDMSIVGPRPFVPVEGKVNTDKDFNDRLLVKPGITGYTQAYFRNSISQDEKVHLDAEYARNMSLVTDLKIIFKTVDTVIKRKNIYQN